MEAMAVRTQGGLYQVAIERTKTGDVGQIDVHLSLTPNDESTSGIQDLLAILCDVMGNVDGEREVSTRLYALIHELENDVDARAKPGEGEQGEAARCQ